MRAKRLNVYRVVADNGMAATVEFTKVEKAVEGAATKTTMWAARVFNGTKSETHFLPYHNQHLNPAMAEYAAGKSPKLFERK